MTPTAFCGLQLAHPVLNGSGTFDAIAARRVFGEALLERFPFSAYVSKTITREPRHGNPPPRLYETASGMVNSIGLPNKGLDAYLEQDLPQLAQLPVPLIVNVMADDGPGLAELVAAVAARDEVAAVELNVSCPNVHTGLDLGADPASLSAALRVVRPVTDKPLIVKLTPNTADVALVARAAAEQGADAVSLINTLRAMPVLDGRPWLGGERGGLSGPAIRQVALAQVATVAAAIDLPIVGMGGIETADHGRQMVDAGATLVAVGTASFRDPAVASRIADGLRKTPAISA